MDETCKHPHGKLIMHQTSVLTYSARHGIIRSVEQATTSMEVVAFLCWECDYRWERPDGAPTALPEPVLSYWRQARAAWHCRHPQEAD